MKRRRKGSPSWLKPGVKVDYHSIIGGPVTAPSLEVVAGPQELGGPGGTWCVWLDGKSGCVSVEAVTPAAGVSP